MDKIQQYLFGEETYFITRQSLEKKLGLSSYEFRCLLKEKFGKTYHAKRRFSQKDIQDILARV